MSHTWGSAESFGVNAKGYPRMQAVCSRCGLVRQTVGKFAHYYRPGADGVLRGGESRAGECLLTTPDPGVHEGGVGEWPAAKALLEEAIGRLIELQVSVDALRSEIKLANVPTLTDVETEGNYQAAELCRPAPASVGKKTRTRA